MTDTLDPARVTHAAVALVPLAGMPTFRDTADAVLAADDARAREAGLICAADGLTVEMLRHLTFHEPWRVILADLPAALRERIEGQS